MPSLINTLTPTTQLELATLLREANTHQTPITPTTGQTKPWGNPLHPAIHLTLANLNQVQDHPWQDMTCTVEAGCLWSTLQTTLAQHGQRVALDPLHPDRATVGGIVATNDSGSLRQKYGSLRDLILGMTLILADGTIARTGGKVVKNVAGYDLHKLLCGSFGTLAIIAEVTFRCHPLEPHAQTWSISAFTPEALAAPLRTLLDSQLDLTSLQLRSTPTGFALDLRIAALPETIASQSSQIEALQARETTEDVWQTRQRLFDTPNRILLKASLLPTQIPTLTARLHEWATAASTGIETVTQTTGLMTIALASTPAAETILTRLRATGTQAIVLQSPLPITDPWGSPPPSLPLMQELKRRFDPNRILNPGRFVGGI